MICPHCKSKDVLFHQSWGEEANARIATEHYPIMPRNYPVEFKEIVVKAVRQASRIFKLSPKTVIAWKREFSNGEWD